ncbi:glycosyltransferase family 4 protein [Rhodanobacter sp. DHB23]|uniref:glycosyltransferase family 4 protein n=1 Tax=Rhodanobacter sp. DHB23 TaxID=2775923 RepID=UPI00177D4304|nr:glycosyltransferase family 4 protein [Rhodanobacter sp. DHB23]MBD8872853.1 glycosyltransferase family 4 protein [Rhodanobacter sp. DHB23]
MMRVCHMSSAHRGLDIRIFEKECVSLANAGYETHLIITASDEAVKKAAAKNVFLHAMPASSGRFMRMFQHGWRCYWMARGIDADIYHFHDPELIPYGIILSLSGKRVIYDSHEDLPRDILDKEWIRPWMRRIVAKLSEVFEYIGARWFFSVVAATPFIAERFKRVTSKSIDINNYPVPDELTPAEVRSERCKNVCYIGSISRARGLKPIIEALPRVPDMGLILCGEFADKGFAEELRAMPGWSQVDYRGQVNRDGVRSALNESIAGMVTLLPTRAYLDSLPIKMFEYMAAGLPVISSDFPLWRRIVDGAQAGICVDPMSSSAIVEALRNLSGHPMLAARMGEAGRQAVLEKYNWPNEAEKLINFYKNL